MTNRYAILPMIVFQDERLSKTDMRVLGIITAHANKTGRAWPSRTTISELSACTPRNITRSINRIIKFGYMSRAGKVGRATKYALRFETLADGNIQNPSKMAQGDVDLKVSQNIPAQMQQNDTHDGKCVEMSPVSCPKMAPMGVNSEHPIGVKTVQHRTEKEQTTNNNPQPPGGGGGGSGNLDIFFPDHVSESLKGMASRILESVPSRELKQELVDELIGAMASGTGVQSPGHYLRKLRDEALAGNFFPHKGLSIAGKRDKQKTGGSVIETLELRWAREEAAKPKVSNEEVLQNMDPDLARVFRRMGEKMGIDQGGRTVSMEEKKREEINRVGRQWIADEMKGV